MKVVALSGKMHSGKTFVADRLVEEYGFVKLSFATAIKDDVREMGFPEEAIREKPPWMRQFLQAYGQAWRAANPDHWVEQVISDIYILDAAAPSPSSDDGELMFVIDDMRFKNELKRIGDLEFERTDCGVMMVRINRHGYPRAEIPGHDDISECDLDDITPEAWDQIWHIPSGDIETLKMCADDIANVMGVDRRG